MHTNQKLLVDLLVAQGASYEVIDNGITALTIDWESMGIKAAHFVLNNTRIHEYLPTEVIVRSSL